MIQKFFDILMEFLDLILPGLMSVFSGVYVTGKKRGEQLKQIYKKHNRNIKIWYFVFTLAYLLFIYFVKNQTTWVTSIYLKIFTVFVNLALMLAPSFKSKFG